MNCHPRPKVLSASVSPYALYNGRVEVRFTDLNFHENVALQCRINDSAYEVPCSFDAQVPGDKSVLLTLNGHELSAFSVCFSFDLLKMAVAWRVTPRAAPRDIWCALSRSWSVRSAPWCGRSDHSPRTAA